MTVTRSVTYEIPLSVLADLTGEALADIRQSFADGAMADWFANYAMSEVWEAVPGYEQIDC